ncbi:MAG: DMT family transporter [Candidatus Caldatribacteriota bacterium]|nr:DMT family transporter [Candidatus Caldatribacteriota bacterium]
MLNNIIKNNAVYIKLFLVALFFGSTFIAGRIMSANLPPFTSAFLRFLLASFFLVFIVIKIYGGLPRLNFSQIILVICLGITGVAGYNFFFFSGLKFIAASRASMIISLNPSIITILSILIFKDKLTKLKFTGIILSLTGALIVISHGNLQEILQGKIGLGELFILGCVICWCSFSVLGKIAMKHLKPIIAITYACLAGTLILLIPAILEGELPYFLLYNLEVWPSVFVLGFFGTALAFTWFYEGIDKIGPAQAGIFINFVPVFATTLAVLILHEKLYPSLLIGAVFVFSGVFLNNYRPKQDKIA